MEAQIAANPRTMPSDFYDGLTGKRAEPSALQRAQALAAESGRNWHASEEGSVNWLDMRAAEAHAAIAQAEALARIAEVLETMLEEQQYAAELLRITAAK